MAKEKNEPTEMIKNYLATKQKYSDCLLFYRLGDFYELFFEDAKIASKVLGIVETHRGQYQNKPIPMCGVPFHAYENYLVRLVKAGYKVAICEQMETPEKAKERNSKTIDRKVNRIVTPGTLTEESLLNARKNNFIACLVESAEGFGIAWCDMSTGDLKTQFFPRKSLPSVLTRLNVAELIISDTLSVNDQNTLSDYEKILTILPEVRFSSKNAKLSACQFFQVHDLQCFGDFSKAEETAVGVLLDYILLTQKGAHPVLLPPQKQKISCFMEIDAATRRNLELISPIINDRQSLSLLDVIDFTKTNTGARKLAEWVANPLLDITKINERLDKIDYFIQNASIRDQIRSFLNQIPDIERSLTRLSLKRGGPRDMVAIAKGLSYIPSIRLLTQTSLVPEAISKDQILLGEHSELVELLQNALVDDPPLLARDGKFIRQGYFSALDDLIQLKSNTKQCLVSLQEKYINATGVHTLKIGFNNILGYFVEVPAKSAELLLKNVSLGFLHRQTLVNNVRFTTVELSDLDAKIAHSSEQVLSMEMEIFEQLRNKILSQKNEIIETTKALAHIDIATSLAYVAEINNWHRPVLTDGNDFVIQGGRHPVVETVLKREHHQFIANDCTLGEPNNNLWLLTGPNMTGKSTFLRQNALMAVLAQIGSFVPADYARIGIVDKLFSRVGASDDLARGRSTFMVEMVEVASILNGATEKSLVILDEVGRGTATYDGLSLAWAVVEYLHNVNRSRSLFATHYHELTALHNRLPAISLHTMRVKEWKGDIVFLHEVTEGAVDRSYGIHVAKLAGIPAPVLERARQILEQLEEKKREQKPLFDDLPLFSNVVQSTYKSESKVEESLKMLNIDMLSPREALSKLYELKDMLQEAQ